MEHWKRLTGITQTVTGVTATFEDGTVAVGQLLVGADDPLRHAQDPLPATPPPVYTGYILGTNKSNKPFLANAITAPPGISD